MLLCRVTCVTQLHWSLFIFSGFWYVHIYVLCYCAHCVYHFQRILHLHYCMMNDQPSEGTETVHATSLKRTLASSR